MENLEIGKLEAYINAVQEARVPIAYKALKAEDNGYRRGPEGRHVRAAAEARTYAVAEVVRACSGDTPQPCCAKINSGD
jgi:hypothetical protein